MIEWVQDRWLFALALAIAGIVGGMAFNLWNWLWGRVWALAVWVGRTLKGKWKVKRVVVPAPLAPQDVPPVPAAFLAGYSGHALRYLIEHPEDYHAHPGQVPIFVAERDAPIKWA